MNNQEITEKAVKAMEDAVSRAVKSHWDAGRPVAIWENGKAVWKYPPWKVNIGVIKETDETYRAIEKDKY